MTPEHTDRDLRERAQALLDAWDAHGYMRPSSLAAAFGDLRAALTASEGPRFCPTCGSDDPARTGRQSYMRCPDPFHGIEVSEGESASYSCFDCGVRFNSAERVSVEGTTGPYVSCPGCGRTLYLNDSRVRARRALAPDPEGGTDG